jgi:RNA polymerase sigma factor (sigma-70 family)
MDQARRTSITQALARLADGDRSSFPALMNELWPVLLAFASRLVGERADAEDVAQETLIKIAARIADYDRSRDGLTWAYAIAAYEIRTWRRKRYRRRELPSSEGVEHVAAPTPTASVEEDYMEEQLRQVLAEALGTLSASDREALGITERTTISGEISDAAMRKRRQRAVSKLRSLWSQLYG